MSKLAKLVYVSDKLDPIRGWDSKPLIDECIKDLDKGFIKLLEDNVKYLKEHNISLTNKDTKECIEYYLKGEYKC